MKILNICAAAMLICSCGCGKGQQGSSDENSLAIAALSPHIAEIAYSLDLTDNIVAIGRYCRRPEGFDAPAVADALSVNSEALAATGAKIILHNSREEFFTPLKQIDPHVKVVKLTNANLDELFDSIKTIGSLCDRSEMADKLIADISSRFEKIKSAVGDKKRPRVLFLEGFDPPYSVGDGWVVTQLIDIAGGKNATAEAGFGNWSTLNIETIVSMAPEIIICHISPGSQDRAEAFGASIKSIMASDAPRIVFTDDNSLTVPGANVADTAERFYEFIWGSPVE